MGTTITVSHSFPTLIKADAAHNRSLLPLPQFALIFTTHPCKLRRCIPFAMWPSQNSLCIAVVRLSLNPESCCHLSSTSNIYVCTLFSFESWQQGADPSLPLFASGNHSLLNISSSVPRKCHLPVSSGEVSIRAVMLESRPVQGPLSLLVFALVLSVLLATFLQLSPPRFPRKQSPAATTAPLPCPACQSCSLSPASYRVLLTCAPCSREEFGRQSRYAGATHSILLPHFGSSLPSVAPPRSGSARHWRPALAVTYVPFWMPRWPGRATIPW